MKKILGTGMILMALASCDQVADEMTTDVNQEPVFLQMNKQADADLHLITRVTLARNHVVEFYEPSPGQVIASEAGDVSQAPTEKFAALDGMLPSQAYSALTDAPPPPALLAAEQRMRDRVELAAGQSLPATDAQPTPDISSVAPTTTTTLTASAEASNPAVRAQAGTDVTVNSALTGGSCASEWFKPQFCPTKRQFVGDYLWCMLDWWGGAYAKSSNTDSSQGTVCADIGNVTLKVTTSDHGGGTWTVPQGTWRRWTSGITFCGPFSFWCDFSCRYDIADATNSRFNFAGNFAHRD